MKKIDNWVLKSLCLYDRRNPDNCLDPEYGIEPYYKNVCYCDNCFYGRDRLAKEIIKLTKDI